MRNTRLHSGALAAVLGIGLLLGAGARPALAGGKENGKEKAYRIATYALGGLTAYGAVKKNLTIGLLGAAGTYLAQRKWKDEIEDRHKRNQ